MMVSPLSGSNNEIELVKIETEELSLTIKEILIMENMRV